MANYMLAYHGGDGNMPTEPDEVAAVMAEWGAWYGTMGDAVVDGGAPFSVSQTVTSGGAVSDGNSKALTGYSIVSADSVAAATEHAKGCPVLANGGTVEVYECMDMGG